MRLTDTQIERIGVGIALVLPTWRDWIHRTVNCVAFRDDSETRHAITKYFTVPDRDRLPAPEADSEWCYLPIARLRKGLALNFDVAEATGASVAVVPSAVAAQMCLAAFDALCEASVEEPMPPEVRKDILEVLGRDRDSARSALERFGEAADHGTLRTRLQETRVFWQLAELLADDRLIIAEVPATPGQTRIVSFSFDVPSPLLVPLGLVPKRQIPSQALAFRAKSMILPLPDVGDAGSYHLEAEAPPGLQFHERRLALSDPDRELEARPSSTRRAVFDIAGHIEAASGVSRIRIRPEAGTLVTGGTIAAVVTAALLAWIGARVAHIDPDAAATVLVLVPGLLTLFIARPDEHPLTSKALLGLRIAALVPMTVSIVGAAVFIGGLDQGLTQRILYGLAATSLVTGVAIGTAWRLSRPRRPRPAPTENDQDIVIA